MKILITGGAGFLGTHLCKLFLSRGDEVVCVDNLSTGRRSNIVSMMEERRFEFVRADVADDIPITGHVDAVAHFASPASPPDYHERPLDTLRVGSRGTENALRVAEHHNARFVVASTSEIYGDPAVHPQREDYWGNVNPIGPRSVYDEAKRFAEAMTAAYARADVNAGIVRIFNTYGPRMRADDGRVVSSLINQALLGDPLTIYGSGSQTRSFCYVDDLIAGIVAMIDSDFAGPINLGNPAEFTVAELAEKVLTLTGSRSEFEFHPLPTDDPTRRCPDITKARNLLRWEPTVALDDGLQATIKWFQQHPEEVRSARVRLAGDQSRAASSSFIPV